MMAPMRQILVWAVLTGTCLLTAGLSDGLAAGDREVAAASAPSSRAVTTQPRRKNIFFPEKLVSRLLAYRSDMPIRRPFVVKGVSRSDQGDRVVLQLRNPDQTVHVEKGDSIANVELVDIVQGAAVFRIAGEVERLKAGQSSGRLLLGKRTFPTHCTIVGTSIWPGGRLALAEFRDQKDCVYLGVGDMLPTGRVAAIDQDAITIRTPDYAEITIKVGQKTNRPVLRKPAVLPRSPGMSFRKDAIPRSWQNK